MQLNNKEIEKRLTKDLSVIMEGETDKAFRSKTWEGAPWTPRKSDDVGGSLLILHGTLRRSIDFDVQGNRVIISSELPYANIHNEGGRIKIEITPAMRRFFLARYLQTKKVQWLGLYKKKKTHITVVIHKRQFAGVQQTTDKEWDKAVNKVFSSIDYIGTIKAQIKR